MPLSRLHPRHSRRVQTCLVLYLSALLLYPQVSCPPAASLPSTSARQGRERVDLNQLSSYARHLWSHRPLLATLQMMWRGRHWEVGECLQICGTLEAGIRACLSPGKVKILGHSVHSFREPRAHLTMPRSAQVHFLLSISARGREDGNWGTGALHRPLEI